MKEETTRLSASLEDYLKEIYLLNLEGQEVRITDIARSLGISKPSVNRAMNTLKELELLEPYGQGNEKPQFAQKDMVIRSASVMGRNRNVVRPSLANERGVSMNGVVFTEGDLFMEEKGNSRVMDIIYYPGVNEYNGNRNLQIVVKDWKFH